MESKKMKIKKTWILLLLIIIVAFFLYTFPMRLGAHYWDECVYLQHGEILAGLRNNNYNEFNLRPPLLSIIIGATFLIHHSIPAVHIVLALFSVSGIIWVYLLGKEIFDEKTGLFSSFLYAFTPILINLSHDILVDPILSSFWAATILFLVLAVKKNELKFFAAMGITAGLSVLLKFTSLYLIFIIFIVFLVKYKKQIMKFMYSKKTIVLYTSFLLILLPYLIINKIMFDSMIYPFVMGYKVIGWSMPSHPLTYLKELYMIMNPIIIIGVLSFSIKKIKQKIKIEELILIISIILPFLFLQKITHKEIRYLLFMTPFLSILAANGFIQLSKFLNKKTNKNVIGLLFLVSISLIVIPSSLYISNSSNRSPSVNMNNLKNLEFFNKYEDVPVFETSQWLKNNTLENAIVYSNYHYPIIAYYSKRQIHILPLARNFYNETNLIMKHEGYFVYDSLAREMINPKLTEIIEDDRFDKLQQYENEHHIMIIFKYTPINNSQDK